MPPALLGWYFCRSKQIEDELVGEGKVSIIRIDMSDIWAGIFFISGG